jgi:DNA-binding GntR family transcriptional regulator
VYEKTKDRILLIRLDADYRLSTVAVMQTIQEHLRIIASLQARDVAAALAAMDDHMARSLHRAIGL